MAPSHLYQQRQQEFDSAYQRWQQKFNTVSLLRVLSFLVGVLGAWLIYQLTDSVGYVLLELLFFFIVFVFLLKKHNAISWQRNQNLFLAQLNREEQERLQGSYHPTDTGSSYADTTHFYSGDLDLFGRKSLFALLNRTNTAGGNRLLAQWLLKAAPKQEIEQRQQAIQELAGALEWRQQFQAFGRHSTDTLENAATLKTWLEAPPAISNLPWITVVSILLRISTLLAGAAYLLDIVTYLVPLAFVACNALLLRYTFKEITETVEQTYQNAKTLRTTYVYLLRALENHPFQARRLQELKEKIYTKDVPASVRIRQLSSLLTNLQYRQNPYFYLLVNSTLLWDLYWMLRLEKWKKLVKGNMEQWIAIIAEAEALNSLAGFYYSNPDFVFPVITEANLVYQAKELGHPLLLPGKRVNNSFKLRGEGKTAVITGSNMSGKSTFLRTIGINGVLAMAGAPVCARHFETSIFQVFTSMRTQDSLEESVSSFYAELKRLKQLIEMLPLGQPVFYLLDEILKGTNSLDRNAGAQALIRQFHKHNASGLISTHDLALGEMTDELPGFVYNYSFNSEVIDEELIFDYKLQEGVCRSFNASKLMQQIGIEMKQHSNRT
jgi:hypothetical protein